MKISIIIPINLTQPEDLSRGEMKAARSQVASDEDRVGNPFALLEEVLAVSENAISLNPEQKIELA